jgi:hypothetical protein
VVRDESLSRSPTTCRRMLFGVSYRGEQHWSEYRIVSPEDRDAVFETLRPDLDSSGFLDEVDAWQIRARLDHWRRVCNYKTEAAQPYVERRTVTGSPWARYEVPLDDLD